MTTNIESVPNADFSVQALVTESPSIVSRRQLKPSCVLPASYSHNKQSALKSDIQFKLTDAEHVINIDSLRWSFDITIADTAPPYLVLKNGWSDLIDRFVIGQDSGLVIEDIQHYNRLNAIFETVVSRDVEETSTDMYAFQNQYGSYVQAGATYHVELKFKQSSFLNRLKVYPLFLNRTALVFTITLAPPHDVFVVPTKPELNEIERWIPANHLFAGEAEMKAGVVTNTSESSRMFLGIYELSKAGVAGRPWVLEVSANKWFYVYWVNSADANTYYRFRLLGVNVDGMGDYPVTAAEYAYARFGILKSAPLDSISKVGAPILDSAAPIANAETAALTAFDYSNTSYTIQNNEMILDYYKPSGEYILKWLDMYKMPSGIPFTFNKFFYHQQPVVQGAQTVNINLGFVCRSLKGILMTIGTQFHFQDVNTKATAGGISASNVTAQLPRLNSFMMRGLKEAKLVVGAQQFPDYRLLFNSTQVTQHLLPLHQLFAMSGADHMMTPRYIKQGLNKNGENYMKYGNFGLSTSVNAAAVATANTAGNAVGKNGVGFYDTTAFILGISTMRKDGDFTSGIDTSASGSITLQLIFDNADTWPGQDVSDKWNRLITVYGIGDCVYTKQRDGDLVRY